MRPWASIRRWCNKLSRRALSQLFSLFAGNRRFQILPRILAWRQSHNKQENSLGRSALLAGTRIRSVGPVAWLAGHFAVPSACRVASATSSAAERPAQPGLEPSPPKRLSPARTPQEGFSYCSSLLIRRVRELFGYEGNSTGGGA